MERTITGTDTTGAALGTFTIDVPQEIVDACKTDRKALTHWLIRDEQALTLAAEAFGVKPSWYQATQAFASGRSDTTVVTLPGITTKSANNGSRAADNGHSPAPHNVPAPHIPTQSEALANMLKGVPAPMHTVMTQEFLRLRSEALAALPQPSDELLQALTDAQDMFTSAQDRINALKAELAQAQECAMRYEGEIRAAQEALAPIAQAQREFVQTWGAAEPVA